MPGECLSHQPGFAAAISAQQAGDLTRREVNTVRLQLEIHLMRLIWVMRNKYMATSKDKVVDHRTNFESPKLR